MGATTSSSASPAAAAPRRSSRSRSARRPPGPTAREAGATTKPTRPTVAFLLAALSSLHLTSTLTGKAKERSQRASADAVVVNRDQSLKEVKLRPGQRVVGHGEALGTVYRLDDGRAVIVRRGAPPPSSSR